MGLLDEIREQPRVLTQLQVRLRDLVLEIGRWLATRDVDQVHIVARGSSDHAGLYAKYLLGIANRLPVAMALPSLYTMYDAPPRLGRALVIGISQSGRSPDIVRAVAEARRQGAPTVVVTNDPASPLAAEGDYVLDLQAGAEHAVAATKTYTAQLLALALLSAGIAQDRSRIDELAGAGKLVDETLALNPLESVATVAERYRYMSHCVVLGRGYNYATAHEWSLKLKELTYVVAEPYSSADFKHGPIAIVERGFPVLAVIPTGRVAADLEDLALRLEDEKGAELLIVSDQRRLATAGRRFFALPEAPEWLSPLVAIVPAQLFAYALTRARGLDPEHPRGLLKVTETN